MHKRKPAIVVTKPVEFFDTDMAGIVHFSCFFRYMEFAEARFFEQLDFPLIALQQGAFSGFPRVKTECQYSAPLHFGETVTIELYVDAVGRSSLSLSFRFRRVSGETSDLIAKGSMTTVFAAVDHPGAQLKSSPLPDALRGKLEALIETA